jgi:DNA-binding beta-propeller fold protein YncE
VANAGTNNISVFSINTVTGALTPVPGSPFPTGAFSGNGISLAVTPDNKFLFAASAGSSSISTFSIAPNGALAPVAGSTVFVNSAPDGVKVTPNGRFLMVAMPGPDLVGVFSINPNGTLVSAPGSPFPAPGFGIATGVEVNCASNLLFVGEASFQGTNIDVFNIASGGALTAVPGSPFNNPAVGVNSNVVVLSRDDRFLFASNQFSNSVTAFSVAPGGPLSLIPGSPFPTGGFTPCGMAINLAGAFLYVANLDSSSVSVFSIGGSGALVPVPGSPFITGPAFGNLFSLTAFPAKSCSNVVDIRLQDDANGNLLKLNSGSGEYQFINCRKNVVLTGKGKVTRLGGTESCKIELVDNGPDPKRPDRRVSVLVNLCTTQANASVSIFSTGQTYSIADSNIQNSAASCP